MVEIELKVRRCDACDQKAVALDGEGTPCQSCDDGNFGDWDGETLPVEVSPEVAEQYAENFPEQVA